MLNVLLALFSFAFMEFVAWSNHKFVMHVFLWKWHKDHHINDYKKLQHDSFYQPGLERNDYFFSGVHSTCHYFTYYRFWVTIRGSYFHRNWNLGLWTHLFSNSRYFDSPAVWAFRII